MRSELVIICLITLLATPLVAAQTETTTTDLPDCQAIQQQLEETKEYAEETLNSPDSTEEEKEEARRDIERAERSVQECELRREQEMTEPEGRCEKIQHDITYGEELLEVIPEEETDYRRSLQESIDRDKEMLEKCRLNEEYRENIPANKCERIEHQIEYTEQRIEVEEDQRVVEEMKKDVEQSQKLLEECKAKEKELKQEPCGELQQKVRDLQSELRMADGAETEQLEQEVEQAIQEHQQCLEEKTEEERDQKRCMRLKERLHAMTIRKNAIQDDIRREGETGALQQELETVENTIEETKQQLEGCEDVEMDLPTPEEMPQGRCAGMEFQVERQEKILERIKEESGEERRSQERIEHMESSLAEAKARMEWCKKEKELEDSMSQCEVMEEKLAFYKQNLDGENTERRIASMEERLERCKSMQAALSSKCGYLNITLQQHKQGLHDVDDGETQRVRKVIRQLERGLRGCKLVTGEDAQCQALDDELSEQSDYIDSLEDQNEELRKRLKKAGGEVPARVERNGEKKGFFSAIFGRIVG